jgi:hypothetical protein
MTVPPDPSARQVSSGVFKLQFVPTRPAVRSTHTRALGRKIRCRSAATRRGKTSNPNTSETQGHIRDCDFDFGFDLILTLGATPFAVRGYGVLSIPHLNRRHLSPILQPPIPRSRNPATPQTSSSPQTRKYTYHPPELSNDHLRTFRQHGSCRIRPGPGR